MRELLVATSNAGKLGEIQEALRDLPFRVLSPAEFGALPPVVEDGDSFLYNAQKKARSAAQASGYLALADDSGLEIDALEGAPGVFSARYAGEGASDAANIQKVLDEMRPLRPQERRATFRTVLVLAEPQGREDWVAGSLEGEIAVAPRGQHGFGYDPIFYLPRARKTLAEFELSEKNRLSQRGEALARLRQLLLRW